MISESTQREDPGGHKGLSDLPFGLEPLLTWVGTFLRFPLEWESDEHSVRIPLRVESHSLELRKGGNRNDATFWIVHRKHYFVVCPKGVITDAYRVTPCACWIGRWEGRILHDFLRPLVQ